MIFKKAQLIACVLSLAGVFAVTAPVSGQLLDSVPSTPEL